MSTPMRMPAWSRALGLALCLCASGAAMPAARPAEAGASSAAARSMAHRALVDLNTASRAQLKTLPGIGDAEAERIIAARPYVTKAELATKGAVPTGVYVAVRRHVIVRARRPVAP